MKWSLRKISFLIYCLSFLLPIYFNVDIRGYEAFIWGFFSMIESWLLVIIWFSNIFYFFSFFARVFNSRLRLLFSLASIVSAILFFFYEPSPKGVSYPGIGYAFWLSSFVINFIDAAKELKSEIVKKG
jgi:hypothetical protein